MNRIFNVAGACNPAKHYMVDITERLEEIKKLVDNGWYFAVNRGRQYGKTTTLTALQKYLADDYLVLYMDFQFLSAVNFKEEEAFVRAFSRELLAAGNKIITDDIKKELIFIAKDKENSCDLGELFLILSDLCAESVKPVVLMIDEVDSASNNQVFLDFLAQLRGYYIHRENRPIFQAVILAGVHDIKNIKRRIRPEEDGKVNSPWNIAVDFDVEMSLSKNGIEGMLADYEKEHHTGMDTHSLSQMIYDYTSGYPYLVSRICKLIDEKLDKKWDEQGFLKAVQMILMEQNTLFDSLMGKLINSSELEKIVYRILFEGERMVYNPDDTAMSVAQMYGFIKNKDGAVAISNRIFESRLYNYFLATSESQSCELFKRASNTQNQFTVGNHLNMRLVMEKFVEYYDDIYGDDLTGFDENEGRRRFLLFLRPIINGTGNYYIEAETRNSRRMDVVVDYLGERFVVELKIWRGNAYNERGEQQLSDYLDYFKLKKGYMLSYNFNKHKQIGLREISVGGRTIVEAVV